MLKFIKKINKTLDTVIAKFFLLQYKPLPITKDET
jgi:hypothetical protein